MQPPGTDTHATVSLPVMPQQAAATYRNPVLPGFHPDPSIVRVGEDYYLVTSTFQFFPAIALSHSRDLVNWTPIGHVFSQTEDLDLAPFLDGCGIWAPDISHHEGVFYVFFCLVQLTQDRSVNERGNYMVCSRSIQGPWSRPVKLTEEGNDPSHFVDEDGAHYMLYAAGIPRGRGTKIVRLSDDCTRVVAGPWWMEFEPEKRAPEGPHLFRREGYYYYTLAAGAGIYDGHHQLMARSRHLLGPYEPSPYNPFIVERSPHAAHYHHGHAKLVCTSTGDWWAVYLLRRRLGGFSPLGRETGLDRVDWLPDGWPVLNGGRGPSECATAPAGGSPSLHARGGVFLDDFTGGRLGPEWQHLRRPAAEDHTLTARPGFLRLRGSRAQLSSRDARSVALIRERSHHATFETLLETELPAGSEAGLVCYYDTSCHLCLALTVRDRPMLVLRGMRRGEPFESARVPLPADVSRFRIGLRLNIQGLRREFFWRNGDDAWRPAGVVEEAGFLSDEGTPGWGFTGTLTGLYALRGPCGSALAADFAWLRQTWQA